VHLLPSLSRSRVTLTLAATLLTVPAYATPVTAIDSPQSGSTVSGTFLVGGWAIDTAASGGPGVDAVHVWAYPNPGSGQAPIFLGAATLGGYRPDVATAFGYSPSSGWANSGYNLATSMSPGYYQIVVYARSVVTGNWNPQTTNVTSASTSSSYPCDANPFDNASDSQKLNACLSGGGQIALIPDASPGYLIDSTLVITQPGTEITSNTGGGHVIFRAMGTLYGHILDAAPPAAPFYLRHLSLIGQAALNMSDDGRCGYYGQNADLRGNGFLIDDVRSSYAMCGSGMVLDGTNFEVKNSVFSTNGWPAGTPGRDNSWADGLTVGSCGNGWIHNNVFEENTDIDIVVGGGHNCTVENNQIHNYSRYGFAGMHVGWFPSGDGDHAGSQFRNNQIDSGSNQLSFGLIVGYEPWYTPRPAGTNWRELVTNSGSVTGNVITGAVVNLAIDGVLNGYIQGNSMSGHQGTRGYGCSYSSDYTAHYFGTASIQGGWDARWFFNGNCGTWNVSVPQPGSPGTMVHDDSLTAEQVISSPNGQYHLKFQADGNLVLYDSTWDATWHIERWGTPERTVMQWDGNFVTYHGSHVPVWASGTDGQHGAYLVVQNDGNVVVYSLSGNALWAQWW
jgi:hypothetical protein